MIRGGQRIFPRVPLTMIARMVTARLDSDLIRLRQFLRGLETEAEISAGEVDLGSREVATLKREIEDIELYLEHGSKSFLLRIGIDFGAPRHAP